MRRLLTVVLASLLVTISFVSVASAQTGDSVTGDAQIVFRGLTFLDIDFDAHSGPSGERPGGSAGTAVTCLNVRANQATIGRADGVLIFVEDNADPSEDRLGANTELAAPVVECPDPAALLATGLQIGPVTITTGDITVVDAPALPTAKDQCKTGGWRTYGVFKNQGDCVAFVIHHARLACTFERVAHGPQAFRTKHGRGPYRLFAWERCLKSWIRGEQQTPL